MEQDTFLLFPLHEAFPLFDQNMFFCPQSAGTTFSPRDFAGCSPRNFFAQSGSALSAPTSHVPDAVEWESQGSVGSRRSSDEYSEMSARPMEWRKALEESEFGRKIKSNKDMALGTLPLSMIPPPPAATKMFPCREAGCKKTYTTTEGLRLHNRNIHMKDKRHKCTVEGCDRAFVRASDLKLHVLRIHEHERSYPCSEPNCNKSFACNSELTRHLNCHARSRNSRKRLRMLQDEEDDDSVEC